MLSQRLANVTKMSELRPICLEYDFARLPASNMAQLKVLSGKFGLPVSEAKISLVKGLLLEAQHSEGRADAIRNALIFVQAPYDEDDETNGIYDFARHSILIRGE